MGYMKNIFTEIQGLYPNDLKKQKELTEDFSNWLKGKYLLPKTEEVRELIKGE